MPSTRASSSERLAGHGAAHICAAACVFLAGASQTLIRGAPYGLCDKFVTIERGSL
jgi:hypothetical protein